MRTAKLFNAAEYLDSPSMVAAYLAAAVESGEPRAIIVAAETVARSHVGQNDTRHFTTVKAVWDSNENVWVARSPDLPGLVTEALSLDDLKAKLPDIISSLAGAIDVDVPAEVTFAFSKR